MATRILVWDIPTRVFHWLLAGSFIGAFVTAESEMFRDVHVALGYLLLALIGFRILWGIVGTRYARFSAFAFGPSKVLAYLKSLLTGSPQHYLGHNPAGSWVIYALLLLGVLAGATGYATYNEIGGEWFEELHEAFANSMLALVGVHVAGVVVSSLLHRENLVKSMINGYKQGDAHQGRARCLLADRRGPAGGHGGALEWAYYRGMRILLIEDDKLLGDGIQAGLVQAGFAVDWVQDGALGDTALQTESYAAVVLDLGLPKLSGIELLRRLRARGDAVPVLILTARDAIDDRVKGLDSGADDYVVKPFDLDELAARLRAVTRRGQGAAARGAARQRDRAGPRRAPRAVPGQTGRAQRARIFPAA